jgi:formyltetrahydrofolate-dependent phosphoribosylglycinamide formyltransferase
LKNLVVFASGSGSNFQSIIDAIKDGQLDARIAGFISNNNSAYSVQRAKENNIPFLITSPADFDSQHEYERFILEQLADWNPDLLILAGYLKKIPLKIIIKYDQRILNIHPSLLPKYGGKGFYGNKVHEAVIENKEKESGCTVHVVTEEYDEGPVLGQLKVDVLASDSVADLSKKVLEQEHKLFPEIIQKYLQTLNN